MNKVIFQKLLKKNQHIIFVNLCLFINIILSEHTVNNSLSNAVSFI